MAKTGNFGYKFSGGSSGSIVVTTPQQRPASQDISNSAGSTSIGIFSVTFVVASGICLIDGNSFGRGTYTFGNVLGGLGALSYDATGSTDTKLLIQQ
jgi:hypothetical protein